MPSCRRLQFLGTIPKFDMCFLCTCEWKSFGIPQVLYVLSFELQPSKNPGLLSSKELYPSPLIKKKFEWLLFVGHTRFSCHFPLQFRKTTGSQSEVGNRKGDVLHAQKKNKNRRRQTYIQLKNLCSWSQMSAVLQCTQSPRTFLLRDRAINVHTSAPALLKLGTSNIT